MKTKAKRSKRRTAMQVITSWYRIKQRKTDVTIAESVVGYEAKIPTVKGGGTILLVKKASGSFELSFGTGRSLSCNTTLSMGELEALAVIYDKLQEIK